MRFDGDGGWSAARDTSTITVVRSGWVADANTLYLGGYPVGFGNSGEAAIERLARQ